MGICLKSRVLPFSELPQCHPCGQPISPSNPRLTGAQQCCFPSSCSWKRSPLKAGPIRLGFPHNLRFAVVDDVWSGTAVDEFCTALKSLNNKECHQQNQKTTICGLSLFLFCTWFFRGVTLSICCSCISVFLYPHPLPLPRKHDFQRPVTWHPRIIHLNFNNVHHVVLWFDHPQISIRRNISQISQWYPPFYDLIVSNISNIIKSSKSSSLSPWAPGAHVFAMDLATFSRVTLADFASTGRGAALLCDVKQGDVLLEVPLETGNNWEWVKFMVSEIFRGQVTYEITILGE